MTVAIRKLYRLETYEVEKPSRVGVWSQMFKEQDLLFQNCRNLIEKSIEKGGPTQDMSSGEIWFYREMAIGVRHAEQEGMWSPTIKTHGHHIQKDDLMLRMG